ncbi:MAG: hypothetical protein QM773_02575 [Hyphomonadaceae bacterium]
MKRTVALCVAAIGWAASGSAQPAASGSLTGPFVLVQANHHAAYLLSGMQKGAEPDAVEAWLWTVYGDHALAIATTYRCARETLETHRSETYLKGAQTEGGPMLNPPVQPNPLNGFGASLRLACDANGVASARTFPTLAEALAYTTAL